MNHPSKLRNLSLDNFFNRLKNIYPLSMEYFCNWIDEYKKSNDWNTLFNEVTLEQGIGQNSFKLKAPKFHDLPFAMQYGILVEFSSHLMNKDFNDSELRVEFTLLMETLNKKIKHDQDVEQLAYDINSTKYSPKNEQR